MTSWTLFYNFCGNTVLENWKNATILIATLSKILYLKKYRQFLSLKTTFFNFIKIKKFISVKMESYNLLLDLIDLLNIPFSFL